MSHRISEKVVGHIHNICFPKILNILGMVLRRKGEKSKLDKGATIRFLFFLSGMLGGVIDQVRFFTRLLQSTTLVKLNGFGNFLAS